MEKPKPDNLRKNLLPNQSSHTDKKLVGQISKELTHRFNAILSSVDTCPEEANLKFEVESFVGFVQRNTQDQARIALLKHFIFVLRTRVEITENFLNFLTTRRLRQIQNQKNDPLLSTESESLHLYILTMIEKYEKRANSVHIIYVTLLRTLPPQDQAEVLEYMHAALSQVETIYHIFLRNSHFQLQQRILKNPTAE